MFFSVIERMVLESLNKKSQTLEEIMVDTGLEPVVTFNSLSQLLEEKYILLKNGNYTLAPDKDFSKLQEEEQIKSELKDIGTGIVANYFTKEVKKENRLMIKKVWMSSEDKKVYTALLKNLELFLEGLDKKKTPSPSSLKNKEVVFWGHSTYGGIAQAILNGA